MSELEEFHRRPSTRNRKAQLTIGAIILVLLAVLGVHAYRELPARPHSPVSDNSLPSP